MCKNLKRDFFTQFDTFLDTDGERKIKTITTKDWSVRCIEYTLPFIVMISNIIAVSMNLCFKLWNAYRQVKKKITWNWHGHGKLFWVFHLFYAVNLERELWRLSVDVRLTSGQIPNNIATLSLWAMHCRRFTMLSRIRWQCNNLEKRWFQCIRRTKSNLDSNSIRFSFVQLNVPCWCCLFQSLFPCLKKKMLFFVFPLVASILV